DNEEASLRCARTVRRYFPQLQIVARARNRHHAYALIELGINVIHRETFLTSLDMAGDTLKGLGMDADAIAKTMKVFRLRDQDRLFAYSDTDDETVHAARLGMAPAQEVEQLFERDEQEPIDKN